MMKDVAVGQVVDFDKRQSSTQTECQWVPARVLRIEPHIRVCLVSE